MAAECGAVPPRYDLYAGGCTRAACAPLAD